jgi:hypothetical protein
MVNIYLFIELLGSANAGQTVDALKALQMENCKFAWYRPISSPWCVPGRARPQRHRHGD